MRGDSSRDRSASGSRNPVRRNDVCRRCEIAMNFARGSRCLSEKCGSHRTSGSHAASGKLPVANGSKWPATDFRRRFVTRPGRRNTLLTMVSQPTVYPDPEPDSFTRSVRAICGEQTCSRSGEERTPADSCGVVLNARERNELEACKPASQQSVEPPGAKLFGPQRCSGL